MKKPHDAASSQRKVGDDSALKTEQVEFLDKETFLQRPDRLLESSVNEGIVTSSGKCQALA